MSLTHVYVFMYSYTPRHVYGANFAMVNTRHCGHGQFARPFIFMIYLSNLADMLRPGMHAYECMFLLVVKRVAWTSSVKGKKCLEFCNLAQLTMSFFCPGWVCFWWEKPWKNILVGPLACHIKMDPTYSVARFWLPKSIFPSRPFPIYSFEPYFPQGEVTWKYVPRQAFVFYAVVVTPRHTACLPSSSSSWRHPKWRNTHVEVKMHVLSRWWHILGCATVKPHDANNNQRLHFMGPMCGFFPYMTAVIVMSTITKLDK